MTEQPTEQPPTKKRKLSQASCASRMLRREGYLILDVSSVLTAERLREVYDFTSCLPKPDEQWSREIYDLTRHEGAAALAADVTRFLQPILARQMALPHVGRTPGTITFVNAPPRADTPQCWHRDTTFLSFSVLVPLVAIDGRNGCTQLIPDSRHVGPKRLRAALPRKVSLCMSPGQVAVFDGRLMHRGSANTSDFDRPLLAFAITARGEQFVQQLPMLDWEHFH